MVVVPNFEPGGIGLGLAEMVADEAFSLEAVVSVFSEDEDGKRLQAVQKNSKPKAQTREIFILMGEPTANSTGRKSRVYPQTRDGKRTTICRLFLLAD